MDCTPYVDAALCYNRKFNFANPVVLTMVPAILVTVLLFI
jgi:hypothetical protein